LAKSRKALANAHRAPRRLCERSSTPAGRRTQDARLPCLVSDTKHAAARPGFRDCPRALSKRDTTQCQTRKTRLRRTPLRDCPSGTPERDTPGVWHKRHGRDRHRSVPQARPDWKRAGVRRTLPLRDCPSGTPQRDTNRCQTRTTRPRRTRRDCSRGTPGTRQDPRTTLPNGAARVYFLSPH
jgi:hypothetical protein